MLLRSVRSRPLIAVVLVLVLAAIAVIRGCTFDSDRRESLASVGADGPVEKLLARFYDQTIEFGDCAPFATTDAEDVTFRSELFECGRLEVPLEYDNPDHRSAHLAVLRAPARGEAVGSLVVNPGGPGPTGTYYAAAISQAAADTRVVEQFDIVGFDPRGTGASTPALDCFTDDERDDDAVVIPFIAGGERYTETDTRALAERCAQRSGGTDVLAHAGTRDVARDMDVLRAALGDRRLTYLGASWGTRLGAVYAQMFPGNVRAMVLDGALDPRAHWTSRALSQFAAFQSSFDAMARACAGKADCPLGVEPAESTLRFQELLRPLTHSPAPVGPTVTNSDPRKLTVRAALDGVVAGLYDEAAWPTVVAGLEQLRSGRGDLLLALRDSYHQRRVDGRYNNFLESTTAIYCADEERLTPEQASHMRAEILRTAPFLDIDRPQQLSTRDGCEHWPTAPTLGFPYAGGAEGLAPPLVVSVTGDPATPFADGIALAEALGASVLAVDGNRHGAALIQRNGCIDGYVADYLADLVQPPADARCAL